MWPLYEDDGLGSQDEEEQKEKDAWRGGASRVYFSAFKDLWSRAHDSSLRALRSMDGQDHTIVCNVKTRLCDEATRVLDAAVMNAREFIHDERHYDIASIWDKMSRRQNETVVITEESERNRPVWPSNRTHFESGNVCEAVLALGRQDRGKEREVWRRLQEQSRSVCHNLTHDPCIEPECSIIWEETSDARKPYTISQQRIPVSKAAECPGLHRRKQIELLSPRMIEVPCQARRNSREPAWKKLASRASKRLQSVCTLDGNATLITDSVNEDTASVLNLAHLQTLRKRLPAELDPLIMEPKGTTSTGTEMERRPRGPQRIRFDSFMKSVTPQQPISDVASSIFKSIMKKNASLLLSCTVSEALSNDVSDLLRRADSAPRLNRQFDLHPDGGIQVLVLPPDIVKCDENRLHGSYGALQTQAQQVAKSVPASQISLTSLSLEIASVWRHASTQNIVRHFKLRQWTLTSAYAIDLHERTLLDKEPRVGDADRATARYSTDQEHATPTKDGLNAANNAPDVAAIQVRATINSPKVTVTQVRATRSSDTLPHASSNSVAFKIQDDMSTDDLVTSFIRVELDEEDSANSLLRVRAPISTPRESSIDSKFSSTIDQLARPAVWFLVRLKMLKVNSTSILDALKSIHLEVFETLTLQLHSKLRDISANPSNLQAVDIVETCSAFRHAVWLHIIRMIVECHDHSHGATLHVSCRLLGSPVYAMAIGVKLTAALSNLYELMGGSPVTATLQENRLHPRTISTEEPPLKKSRPDVVQREMLPVRLVCDVGLLEREELFEAISDLKISVVERELSAVIDLVIDEHSAVVLLTQAHFSDEQMMRAMTYELATSQVQFEKLWVIIDDVKGESALHFFYAALANFAIDVQTFVCSGDIEIGEVVRGIIDACAETALSQRRILPKMWFARPFVLEEESQLERFLSSTRIMSPYAAQSVLHKLSIEDLVSKSLDEVTHLIGGSLTSNQVDLLWRLLRSSHGVGRGEQIRS